MADSTGCFWNQIKKNKALVWDWRTGALLNIKNHARRLYHPKSWMRKWNMKKGIITEYNEYCLFCGRPVEAKHHLIGGPNRKKAEKEKKRNWSTWKSTHHRWVKASEDRHTLERRCVRIQPVEGNSWYLVLRRTDTYRNLWSAEYVTTQSIIPSILLTERAGNLSNLLYPARKEGPCTTWILKQEEGNTNEYKKR